MQDYLETVSYTHLDVYKRQLLDQQVFDSTKDIGVQVFKISEMIEDWKEVLTKMPENSCWKVWMAEQEVSH